MFWLQKKKGNTVHLLHQQTSAEINIAHCSSSTTAINSGASTHHSQHRLVIHRSKGSATDLHLPPSTEPSPSAATTDPRINQFHPHQRAVWASPIATTALYNIHGDKSHLLLQQATLHAIDRLAIQPPFRTTSKLPQRLHSKSVSDNSHNQPSAASELTESRATP